MHVVSPACAAPGRLLLSAPPYSPDQHPIPGVRPSLGALVSMLLSS